MTIRAHVGLSFALVALACGPDNGSASSADTSASTGESTGDSGDDPPACALYLRVDQCCNQPFPASPSEVEAEGDPCVVPWPGDWNALPPDRLTACQPDHCQQVNCNYANPPTEIVEPGTDGMCRYVCPDGLSIGYAGPDCFNPIVGCYQAWGMWCNEEADFCTCDGELIDANCGVASEPWAHRDWERCLACDPVAQDCSEGEKCVPYGSSGGWWDANKCVPVMGDHPPGDACTYINGVFASLDDCDESSFCWNVGEDGVGTCTPFCAGSIDEPTCDEGRSCRMAHENSVILCHETCHPVEQTCEPDRGCYWDGIGFLCLPTTADIPTGEPCGFTDDCEAGNACLPAELLSGCNGASCCATYCDLGDPNTCADTCVPFFDPETSPASYANIGVCI